MRLNEFGDFAFTNLVRTTKINEDVIKKFPDIFKKSDSIKPSSKIEPEEEIQEIEEYEVPNTLYELYRDSE